MDAENKPQSEMSASLIFTEMMRQAAQKATHQDMPQDAASVPPVFDDAPMRSDQPDASAPAPTPVKRQPPPREPLSPEERRRAAELEAQRLKRVQRRQSKRRQTATSTLGGIVMAFMVVGVSALLMATILSLFTDASFLKPDMRRSLQAALNLREPTSAPTILPTPNYLKRIGVVSGHRGPGQDMPYDPGAVCPDGLTENEINFNVATRVVEMLRQQGYTVDLLDEFDPRLNAYTADALISIHANTCSDFGEVVSGFLVAKAAAKPDGGADTRLAECIATHYGLLTGLQRRDGLTEDMTDYHNFREIDPITPAAIIELGFMLADRQIMTEKPDLLARGIYEGVLCYIDPTASILGQPSPLPTEAIGTPELSTEPTPAPST
jgi:N-acetylmuramoyl-L-alanine amidase